MSADCSVSELAITVALSVVNMDSSDVCLDRLCLGLTVIIYSTKQTIFNESGLQITVFTYDDFTPHAIFMWYVLKLVQCLHWCCDCTSSMSVSFWVLVFG
jgi:hypothetical protein